MWWLFGVWGWMRSLGNRPWWEENRCSTAAVQGWRRSKETSKEGWNSLWFHDSHGVKKNSKRQKQQSNSIATTTDTQKDWT